jgi:hypothetical protein
MKYCRHFRLMHCEKRTVLIAISLSMCFFITSSLAQEKDLLTQEQNWYEGMLVLTDESELKGLIRYNDRESFVSFNDGDNKRVFTQASVVWFSFFDHFQNVKRTFLSLPFPDAAIESNPKYIFEVIREYKTFAILLRKDPIAIKQVNRGNSWNDNDMGVYNNTGVLTPFPTTPILSTEVSQVETIYLMDDSGKIMPYLEVRNREDGKKSLFTREDRKTRNKMIDFDLLEKYVTEAVYDKLEKYAQENDLKFHRKEDFLKIIGYYDTLVAEN